MTTKELIDICKQNPEINAVDIAFFGSRITDSIEIVSACKQYIEATNKLESVLNEFQIPICSYSEEEE